MGEPHDSVGRGARDRKGRHSEETQNSGDKRKDYQARSEGHWNWESKLTGRGATRAVKGKEGGDRKRKQVFKTRHFPNYRSKCRVALRGARVTLSIWTMGHG